MESFISLPTGLLVGWEPVPGDDSTVFRPPLEFASKFGGTVATGRVDGRNRLRMIKPI